MFWIYFWLASSCFSSAYLSSNNCYSSSLKWSSYSNWEPRPQKTRPANGCFSNSGVPITNGSLIIEFTPKKPFCLRFLVFAFMLASRFCSSSNSASSSYCLRDLVTSWIASSSAKVIFSRSPYISSNMFMTWVRLSSSCCSFMRSISAFLLASCISSIT